MARASQQHRQLHLLGPGSSASPNPTSTTTLTLAPAMVAIVRSRRPPYSCASRIGSIRRLPASKATPSSTAGTAARISQKTCSRDSGLGSPKPSRSRSRRPVRVGEPRRQQDGALQEKAASVRRDAETVEQALKYEPRQQKGRAAGDAGGRGSAGAPWPRHLGREASAPQPSAVRASR